MKTVTSKRGIKYTERSKEFAGKRVTYWEPTGVTDRFYERLQGEGVRRTRTKKKGKKGGKKSSKKK
jgi:hypothetical protein